MSLTDLMTEAKADISKRTKILTKVGDHRPYDCFNCMRCTSGCPSMKMLENKPHQVVALTNLGLVDELISSEMIWTCALCLKCKERCPQRAAPVDLILALRTSAVERQMKVPEAYMKALSMVLDIGLIQSFQEIVSRDMEPVTRDTLGLPTPAKPSEKFKSVIVKTLTGET